ncbi:uncharacterized protein LOC143364170 [Halictus rubicundus]|uniref:uncharacterized protein LOC143364170 n=1 Tax=Halictus rubicundus TaxID=77578 RepID=UPI004035D1BC
MTDRNYNKDVKEVRREPTRCFNCSGTGHIAAKCTKPKRPSGSCFQCYSMDHQLAECPQRQAMRRQPQQQHQQQQQQPQQQWQYHNAASSINALQPALVPPYSTLVNFSIPNEIGNICQYSLIAMLDSGSPISLVKDSCIPWHVKRPVSENDGNFSGVNESPIQILSIFHQEVEVESIKIKIKFHVVPGSTMRSPIILGRDFTSHPLIKIMLDNGKAIIERKTQENAIDSLKNEFQEILNIEPIEKSKDIGNELQINAEIGHNNIKKIKNMYVDYEKEKKNSHKISDFKMNIVLKHEQPISFRPRRLSFVYKGKLRVLLDDLIERKAIRPSMSPYASPIVLVRKKSGEIRMCVDYRELNKITVKDNYPNQLIDDNIDQLREKRFFTALDLKDGYHHVRMAENSIKYTAFVTPLGQFEYLVCPFGLTNAPKVFSRFVFRCFEPLIRSNKLIP